MRSIDRGGGSEVLMNDNRKGKRLRRRRRRRTKRMPVAHDEEQVCVQGTKTKSIIGGRER